MLDKFWGSLGEDLASEWLKHVFSPAFLFWAGGLGMYVVKHGWQTSWGWLSGLQLVEQVALLIIALVVLVLSSLVMRHLHFNILRLLEGYWPWPFRWLADSVATWKNRRFEKHERQWNELKNREDTLSRREARQLANLELRGHNFPSNPNDVMPTALGNILSAAETAPSHKYGLDAFVCWPRLWLLLPDNAREDMSTARQELITLVQVWAWGLLFIVWIVWSKWAIVIAALWLWLAYALTLRSAMGYADLLESTFDLYRLELYKATQWPPPETSGEAEIATGQRLTEFLWRGEAEPPVQYNVEEKE
jgi:hypothetical protein